MKLALLVSNRGFFPSSVIKIAQQEMKSAIERSGNECLEIDVKETNYGAVETTDEGIRYANFLAKHRNKYSGVIICLPNFGDENGIKAALSNCDVPILIQAYPDDLGKMDFEHRRDAFCGKLALTSVFKQMGLRYTSFSPFVIKPSSEEFDAQLKKFAAVCRIVEKMRRMRIGSLGARTTAFKNTRFDEVALERHGIDVETFDLSTLFRRMKSFSQNEPILKEWVEKLEESADFSSAPDGKIFVLARLGAAIMSIVSEMGLDALAIRCWPEIQQEFGISPCSVMGLLNHEGIPSACEMDITNVLPMMALSVASGCSSGCLDFNNNYGDDLNKCILFHCGPLPLDLMKGPGIIEEHKMLSKIYGQGCSWGLNVGKIRPGNITFAGARTESGIIQYYISNGRITDDPVEPEFFGLSGVMQTQDLQKKLICISEAGFRHHVAITLGDVTDSVSEALTKYLGYQRVLLDG
jgi:L-fucose isomerase-like protein